ncbi:MAG: glycosyl hydrolase [Phycisphaerae bacterium]
MYTDLGFRRSLVGDVDVLKVGDTFHLFHLVLPNHDFIAHSVSKDGLEWRRVDNAFFIGHPGKWDDDMLWTMHVTPDPQDPGAWRMFYTGLSRQENGSVQRVGLARSRDLYHWTKDEGNGFPLEISGEYYENHKQSGRMWVSFRDPFIFEEGGRRLMLASARANQGSLVRRGCVGLAEEVEPNHFEFRAPLHWPRNYDEIEVPGLIEVQGRYFLIGSIREDVKVRYWYADQVDGPYENYFDNVLMPAGNYAARPSCTGGESLIWNFFFRDMPGCERQQMLAPPKELVLDKTGRLQMKSFRGFNDRITCSYRTNELTPIECQRENPHAEIEQLDNRLRLTCYYGFESFVFKGIYSHFRLRASLRMEGLGKCGLLLRQTDQGDGYYVSFDLIKGLVQIRSWSASLVAGQEKGFDFTHLQAGYFVSDRTGPWDIEAVCFGTYLEISVDGNVVLTLANDQFLEGRVGFYVEGACIDLRRISLQEMWKESAIDPETQC